MALLGSAAMLLWYDIVPEAIDAHDEWHTREHFPERVGIPGFLRAQRWVAVNGGPRYFVVYEVTDIGVLSDAPYMKRLNNPTPWTSRTMPNFRGMTRGFCNVTHRYGTVLGTSAATIRFGASSENQERLADWLDEALATLVQRSGIASAFLLESGVAPAMTKEQSIRGQDAGVDQVLWVTGYSEQAVVGLLAGELSAGALIHNGATSGVTVGQYQLVCVADKG
jgi:hypothetical protein